MAAGAGFASRIAGAPISWGVCEVPGWGVQLSADRVLAEMRALGLTATERGPAGFLPGDPEEAGGLLARSGLHLVGGFVPAVLHHDASGDTEGGTGTGTGADAEGEDGGGWEEALELAAAALVAGGAEVLVLAAATGDSGYDQRNGTGAELGEQAWATLLGNLTRAEERCQAHGLALALHPHAGTVIERRAEVERLLAGSPVRLCLDTGHLLIGGTDPVMLARSVPERIAHVHLKDVDATLAKRVEAGQVGYTDAVRQGLYRPLGQGDIDLTAIVAALEGSGYSGWYVLEQDTVLTDEPPPGDGPMADVRASLDYLRSLPGP